MAPNDLLMKPHKPIADYSVVTTDFENGEIAFHAFPAAFMVSHGIFHGIRWCGRLPSGLHITRND